MPIPKPHKDEKEKDFISRCMGDDVMNKEYKDQKVRAGVCYTSWREKDKKKNMSDMSFAEVKDLLNGERTSIKNLEIFNIRPNSHGINFTTDDMKELVEMYEQYSDSHTPNIKLSHSNQQILLRELFGMQDVEYGEELPSLGYAKNLRIEGESIYADVEGVPAVLADVLFGEKLFKAISPEITLDFLGTGKKYINAIGLTNNPSMKHIADVHLSEALKYDGNIIIEGVNTMAEEKKDIQLSEDSTKTLVDKISEKFSDLFSTKKQADTTQPAQETKPENMVAMSELAEMKKSFESQINELKLKLVEKDTAQKNFSEKIKKIEEDTRMEKAIAMCKGAMADGVAPWIVEYWKPVLMSDLGDKTIKFSEEVDGEMVVADKSLTAMVQDFFKKTPKVDFSEKTRTDFSDSMNTTDSEYKKVQKRAEELMKANPKMSRHEALMKARIS